MTRPRQARARMATYAAGTPGRASCSGRFTPCRAKASPATKRGRMTAGRTVGNERVGFHDGGHTARDWCSCRSDAPTSDFYGADRHGDGLYGNSLVALDVETGKLKWFHQLVHHDLWDYDLAAAPALIDVVRGGRRIPAVAQITKMGMLFIFDRVTGEPIYGIEERPVPQSHIPGEARRRQQPFTSRPLPLARNEFKKEDIYSLTPEHAAFCKELFEKNRMFTEGPLRRWL